MNRKNLIVVILLSFAIGTVVSSQTSARAARPFFGGLPDEHQRAGPEFAMRSEPARRAEQCRHVHVVTARVHHADRLAAGGLGAHGRCVRRARFFGDR